MKRRKILPILLCVLLLLVIVPISFWLWPVPLPPIEAEAVAEITYPFPADESRFYHITDREQIDRIVERCNRVTLRRYLPGYQSKLPTSDIVFWDAEGQELRRMSVYHVPAGYQVFSEEQCSDLRSPDVKGIRVLVIDDFLWQVRNDGLEFFFEELESCRSSCNTI